MTQDLTTYYVWIGGSCDYGHKERAGGAAVVIELNGKIISKDVTADLHTTEFRMMLTLMVKVMNELPEGSDILFLTNAAYIQNFDKQPAAKSANPDLIVQCIESKQRHNSVTVKIVHKCEYYGIKTAWDFTEKSESWVRKLFTVTGVRTWNELRGQSSISTVLTGDKQTICTSRCFDGMEHDAGKLGMPSS